MASIEADDMPSPSEAWRKRVCRRKKRQTVYHFGFAPRYDCRAFARSVVFLNGDLDDTIEITVFAGEGGFGTYIIEWEKTSEVHRLPADDMSLARALSCSPGKHTTPYDGAVAALALRCRLTPLEISQLENSTGMDVNRHYISIWVAGARN